MMRPGAGEQPGSVELSVESNGSQKSAVTLSMEGIIKSDNTLILKLVKKGAIYTASCSADGVNFKPVGTAEVVLKDIQSGVMVCDGVASGRMAAFSRMQQAPQPTTPFEVSFDYFRITNNGLK